MKAPDAVSYEELLAYTEDRLWLNQSRSDFAYLAQLVDDLYMHVLETEVATYSGSLQTGKAYRDLADDTICDS